MKIQSKNIKGLFVAGFLAVSSVGGVALLAQSPDVLAAGQTCTWTGAGADNNFSTVANWTGCNDGAPTNGDVLAFNSNGLSQEDSVLTNDISNLTVGGMTFSKTDDGWTSYVINLGSISLDGDITLDGSSAELDGDIQLLRDVELNKVGQGYSQAVYPQRGGALRVNMNGRNITIKKDASFEPSELSGTGSIIAYGRVFIGGASEFTGSYVFHEGAHFSISPGLLNSTSPITVDGAVLVLCGFNGGEIANPLTIGGSIISMAGSCGGLGAGGGTIEFDPNASANWTGPITLTSDTEVRGEGEFTISGALSGDYTIEYKGQTGRVVNNSSNNTSNTQSGSQESKGKEIKLDNQSGEHFNVGVKDTGILTGTYNYGYVFGILKGTGSVASILSVYAQGTVAPGLSPGCLTVGALEMYGTYQVELGGLDACSGYDQIKVTGVTGYSYGVTIDKDSASLALYGFGDFAQKEGDVFVIIDNQTDTDVVGNFKDLPEGAEINVGGAIFTISYKGGDGNDVVLTAKNSVKLPGVPNTGVAQMIKANPAIVAIAGLLTVLATVALSRKQSAR